MQGGGEGASSQLAQHTAITNRRVARLRTPAAEELSCTTRCQRRAMTWDGEGSGWRGGHIWQQSKVRTMQGLGGRRAATTGRRHDGEGERWVVALRLNGDAGW
jgi:hypothetical protein